MNTQTKRRSNSGVTLIEMLVVVTIIALFATLVAPGMFKQGDKAKAVAARVQINNFEQALTPIHRPARPQALLHLRRDDSAIDRTRDLEHLFLDVKRVQLLFEAFNACLKLRDFAFFFGFIGFGKFFVSIQLSLRGAELSG